MQGHVHQRPLESVYASRTDAELSWTQPDPHLSLSLIAEVCPTGSVIDVGGGRSLLPGKLLDLGSFDVWHDRAMFHFLTRPADRVAYVTLLNRTVSAGRHAVIATFAPDGPEKCSGLDVQRYSWLTLSTELGSSFVLLKSVPETHFTPGGKPQSFQYSVFRRI